MLSAHGLRFRHGRRGPWLIDGFDLEVARGEVVGLRGPSGTGKTTIGRLLAGYLTPAEGRVEVDGAPLPTGVVAPVQLVFQHPELAVDPRWHIEEVLAEAGPPDPELFEELGIGAGWLRRFPHELSGGELQRIAVARALVSGAPFLVADEISAMLDPVTQAQLWHALADRARRGELGVLAISHDAALLAAVADRVIDLDVSVRPTR